MEMYKVQSHKSLKAKATSELSWEQFYVHQQKQRNLWGLMLSQLLLLRS